jgi:PH (Pleckstrin Homology) domain-containing protein
VWASIPLATLRRTPAEPLPMTLSTAPVERAPGSSVLSARRRSECVVAAIAFPMEGANPLGYNARMSTFHSKYDVWLVLVLTATVAIEFVAIVAIWRNDTPWVIRAVTSLVLAGAAVLILWTLFTTDYVVTAEALRVRSGPLHWTIPLANIQSVQPSRSIIAGPALSLDRLRVEARGEALLISPKDRAGFLAALVQNDPALRKEGERVTRLAP